MKRNTLVVISLVFSLFVLISCATMSDVLKSKEEGTTVEYSVTEDQAWDIATTVLRWEGCETIETHKSQGYLLTTVGQNFVSAGSLVGVWIEPKDQGNTTVTIVTKRKIQTNLATGLTEKTFHSRFTQAVEIVKSGETLPIDPPNYNN